MAKRLENFWVEVEGPEKQKKKWWKRVNKRGHADLWCLQGMQSWLQLERLQVEVEALGRQGHQKRESKKTHPNDCAKKQEFPAGGKEGKRLC